MKRQLIIDTRHKLMGQNEVAEIWRIVITKSYLHVNSAISRIKSHLIPLRLLNLVKMYLSIASKRYRLITIRYWMPCGIVTQSNQPQTTCKALLRNLFRPTASYKETSFTLSTTLTIARSDLERSFAALANKF